MSWCASETIAGWSMCSPANSRWWSDVCRRTRKACMATASWNPARPQALQHTRSNAATSLDQLDAIVLRVPKRVCRFPGPLPFPRRLPSA
eukprot:12585860-Alexandrium_andersonii.AAC.1